MHHASDILHDFSLHYWLHCAFTPISPSDESESTQNWFFWFVKQTNKKNIIWGVCTAENVLVKLIGQKYSDEVCMDDRNSLLSK